MDYYLLSLYVFVHMHVGGMCVCAYTTIIYIPYNM